MTKREWFEELKYRLNALTNKECQDALNFYEELYQDKIDQGYEPQVVIDNFPNPLDASRKIIEELQEERRERTRYSSSVIHQEPIINSKVANEETKSKPVKQKSKSKMPMAAKIILIILASPFIIALVAMLFGLILGFGTAFISGFVVVISGIIAAIMSVIEYHSVISEMLVYLGGSLLIIGVGLLLIAIFGNIIRGMCKLTEVIFKSIFSKGGKVNEV